MSASLTLRYCAPRGVLAPSLPLLHVVIWRGHARYCLPGLGTSAGSFSGPLINVTEGAAKSSHGRQKGSWSLGRHGMTGI